MQRYSSIRVQRLARVPVDVAALAYPSYGSLELGRLSELNEDLAVLVGSGSRQALVLDLGQKKPLGAGFLKVVNRLQAAAAARGQKLVLAGDDGGLLAAAGWRKFVAHFADLATALNAACDGNAAVHENGPMLCACRRRSPELFLGVGG